MAGEFDFTVPDDHGQPPSFRQETPGLPAQEDITTCADCGAHFTNGPRGSGGTSDGMACENCGGIRLYRNQPSPTQSDGTLRNMVDPISQHDQGGNPLGEGTIMGADSKATKPWGKHDDSFSASGTYSHTATGTESIEPRMHHERTSSMEPYAPLWDETWTTKTAFLGIGNPLTDLKDLGEGALAVATPFDQEIPGLDVASDAEDASLIGDAAGAGASAAADTGGAAAGDAGGAAADTSSGGVKGVMNKALQTKPGQMAQQAWNNKGALGIGSAGTSGAEKLMGGGGGGPSAPASGSAGDPSLYPGAPAPIVQMQGLAASLSSVDIPWLLMADLETSDSVKSVGEQHDDPEHVDQKEFNDGDKSPSNLMNPNNEDSGASGEDGVREKTPGYGFGPNSPAMKQFEALLPLLLQYAQQGGGGGEDPVIQGLHAALEAENPGYLNAPDEHEEHHHQHGAAFKTVGDPTMTQQPDPAQYTPPPTPATTEQFQPGERRQVRTDRGQAQMPSTWSMLANEVLRDPSSTDAARELAQNIMQQRQGAVPMQPQDPNATPPAPGIDPNQGGSPVAPGADPNLGIPGMAPQQPQQQAQQMAQGQPNPSRTDMLNAIGHPGGQHGGQQPGQQPQQQPGKQQLPMDSSLTGLASTIQHMSIVPPGQAQTAPSAAPVPAAATQGMMPSGTLPSTPQPSGLGQGQNASQCANCGATMVPGGNCAQCGAQGGTGGAVSQPGSAGPASVPMAGLAHVAAETGIPVWQLQRWANGQGPVNDEQKQALIQAMDVRPELFADILNEIQKQPNVAPQPNPAQMNQTPPAPPQDPSGAMPMGDPSQPGGGAGQLQPMSRVKLAEVPNPLLQQQTPDTNVDQQSSLSWQDTQGNPMEVGSVYDVKAPGFSVPDRCKVVSKVPHEIGLALVGGSGPSDSGVSAGIPAPDFKISKEQADTGKYSFEPVHDDADKQAPAPNGGMPGLEQIPQSGPTTDEYASSYPNTATSSVIYDEVDNENVCHKCAGTQIDHIHSSAETMLHECYRCGASWETKDDFEGVNPNANLEWIREDSSAGDDFFNEMDRARQSAMAGGGQSRSLAAAASNDSRYAEVRDLLNHNKQQRTAGRHFTPSEQRALINEKGSARNADLLDLEGTHYDLRGDDTGKANGENAPDAHVFMGM